MNNDLNSIHSTITNSDISLPILTCSDLLEFPKQVNSKIQDMCSYLPYPLTFLNMTKKGSFKKRSNRILITIDYNINFRRSVCQLTLKLEEIHNDKGKLRNGLLKQEVVYLSTLWWKKSKRIETSIFEFFKEYTIECVSTNKKEDEYSPEEIGSIKETANRTTTLDCTNNID